MVLTWSRPVDWLLTKGRLNHTSDPEGYLHTNMRNKNHTTARQGGCGQWPMPGFGQNDAN